VNIEWAVHRLLHRYIDAADRCDADAVGECFDGDGVLLVRGTERRGDEIVAFYRQRLTVPTLHFVTGITVSERAGGLVDAGCGLLAMEMPETGWTAVAGRYDDVIRLDGDDARFVSRTITIDSRFALAPAT
jgi:hypothetical protein